VDGSVKSYPLDGGVAVLGAGAAGGTTVSVVVVADWGAAAPEQDGLVEGRSQPVAA
jgi:hypothetical protein